MIDNQRLLNTFLDYVRIDSESRSEGAICRRLVEDLKAIPGCEVYVDSTMAQTGSEAGNIYATLPATAQGEPIILCAHMDTVVPGIGVEPVIEDGIVRSKGDTILGADDKSGIAAIVEAMRTVTEQNIPHPTVQAVFTVCEEIGLLGSRYLEYDRLAAKKAAVLDSGIPGVIVTAGPSQYKIKATVIGRSAHAGGAPQNGISAIQVLCEAISNMKQLRIDPETTANIGSIHADYPTNIVAERASMVAECRSRSPEKLERQAKHMEDCLVLACEKYGATLEFERDKVYSGYRYEEDHPFIQEMRQAMETVGLTVRTLEGGGGSDVNNLFQHGISALMIGTGMAKVHTTSEQIAINELEGTARLALELIRAK